MKYAYNYSFLQQWLDENKDIQKKTVLKALGIKSFNGLKAWTDKKGPMPVLNILRFCNSFHVPLACFFRDIDANAVCDFRPEPPTINDQLEPDGGYDTTARGRGERVMEDPTLCTVMSSRLPDGMAYPMSADVSASANGKDKHTTANAATATAGATTNADTLIALERLHSAQRDRLLNIIEAQQSQIAELTRQLTQQRNLVPEAYGTAEGANGNAAERPYHIVRQYEPGDEYNAMAAEELRANENGKWRMENHLEMKNEE